jgi:ubiquinone/menaquinone biosynthesis C-methylase UbiE
MDFNVKQKVQEHYGSIAQKINEGSKSGCCCGSSSFSCCDTISNVKNNYQLKSLLGLPLEAINASLGCANPFEMAELKEGEAVLDLGSGGGIDVLIASKYVGSTGKVYGLDMTDEMLTLANKNKEKMGVKNVEFIKGYIESIPLPDESIDVIMSNCVINLSEDKQKVLSEAYRVLKEGGRLAIADIVTLKDVSSEIRQMAEAWVSCIAGTVKVEEYISTLEKAGFKDIEIKPVHVYTKEIIEELVLEKKQVSGIDASSINMDEVDGAFAGANIRAVK